MSTPDGPLKRPQTLGGLVYLVVVGAALVGLGIVFAGAWRTGLAWIGAGLLLGGFTRLVLSERRAGMLAVRHRVFDCLLLAGVGGILIFLAATIPNQPV